MNHRTLTKAILASRSARSSEGIQNMAIYSQKARNISMFPFKPHIQLLRVGCVLKRSHKERYDWPKSTWLSLSPWASHSFCNISFSFPKERNISPWSVLVYSFTKQTQIVSRYKMHISGIIKGEGKSDRCSVLESKRRKYFEKEMAVTDAKQTRRTLESKD